MTLHFVRISPPERLLRQMERDVKFSGDFSPDQITRLTEIRPNQIFAVSLAHSPLDSDSQKSVLSLCRRHLLCSFSLRSLAPSL